MKNNLETINSLIESGKVVSITVTKEGNISSDDWDIPLEEMKYIVDRCKEKGLLHDVEGLDFVNINLDEIDGTGDLYIETYHWDYEEVHDFHSDGINGTMLFSLFLED